MKVAYRDIVAKQTVDLLNEIIKHRSQDLPFRVSRYIGVRLMKALQERWKEFDAERAELLKRYGIESGENEYTVDADNISAYAAAFEALLSEQVELTNVDKIKAEDLQNAKLTSAEWVALDWLVAE